MKQINKLSAGFVVMTVMGAVSVFAMDSMATGTMMKDDKMMATGTKMMMHDDDKMMLSDDMMMKIDKKSSKADIKKLQEMLIKKGHLKLAKGAKLGFFGPATMKAYEAHKKIMMKDDKMMKK